MTIRVQHILGRMTRPVQRAVVTARAKLAIPYQRLRPMLITILQDTVVQVIAALVVLLVLRLIGLP